VQNIEERKEYAREQAGADRSGTPSSAPHALDVTRKPDGATARVLDAPLCYSCGAKMQPAGSCYVCTGCGSTSGCS
jgi:ribonucleoside-diphosphate reductase alpha chain